MNQFQNEMLGLLAVHEDRFEQRQLESEPVAEVQFERLAQQLSAFLTALLNTLLH